MQAIQKGVETVASAVTGTTTSGTDVQDNQQQQQQKSGQEPLSGVQGEGTADKPFDQGNQDGWCPNSSVGLEGRQTNHLEPLEMDPATKKSVTSAQ